MSNYVPPDQPDREPDYSAGDTHFWFEEMLFYSRILKCAEPMFVEDGKLCWALGNAMAFRSQTQEAYSKWLLTKTFETHILKQ